MERYVKDCLLEHIRIIQEHQEEISKKVFLFSQKVIAAFESNNKVMLAGNGGSAGDAQHIAAEFVVRFQINRPALPAVALTTDTSVLTAAGNDFGFSEVFSRQVESIGKQGDVLMVFSTSGNSKNLIRAVEAAKKQAIVSLGFLGRDGGELAKILDDYIVIPCENTPRIQELHITMGHILCDIVEEELYGR